MGTVAEAAIYKYNCYGMLIAVANPNSSAAVTASASGVVVAGNSLWRLSRL